MGETNNVVMVNYRYNGKITTRYKLCNGQRGVLTMKFHVQSYNGIKHRDTSQTGYIMDIT